MATFQYTYPAYNGEPDVTNYAANLNYMLSSDARQFALNSLVHTDGLNHPSRSAANLNEFYASCAVVGLAGVYALASPWTMVSNPAGDPRVRPGETQTIECLGDGVWLVGGIANTSVNQSTGVFWYMNTNQGYRYSVGSGDNTALSPRVLILKAPFNFVMYALPGAGSPVTVTFKVFGLRVAP